MDVIALDTCFPFSVFIQQFTFSFSKQMDVGHSKWKIMLHNTNIIIFHVCAVEWYTPENGIQSNKKKENKRVEWEFLRKSKLYLSSFSFSTVVFLFCFFLFVCFLLGEHFVHTAIFADQLHNAITCTILQVTLQRPQWSEDTRVIFIFQIFISNPSWFFLVLEFLQSCFLNSGIWEKNYTLIQIVIIYKLQPIL